MLFRTGWIGVMLMLAATLTAPNAARPAQGRAKKHLLVVTVTKGFRHDSIPVAEQTIEMLGNKTGDWDTDFVRTDAEMQEKMTPAALSRYDAVIFANTTGVLPLPDPQGFLDYIKAGHGFAAMHSGSDTFHTWPGQNGGVSAYIEMLGGEFETHHSQTAIDAHILDPNAPETRPLVRAGAGPHPETVNLHEHTEAQDHIWKVFDEIYILKNNDPSRLHVLLYLDHHPNDGSADANKPGIHLVSWVKPYGHGRVFYTILGHRQEVWRDPLYQEHILGGIRYVLGLARGSTKPNMTSTASK
ncbi:MAG TPA: ThuA domain-containing protein [Chthonomonadaceae bacterium]|nr:ThuA domain-containing protein [Chthonomonadaceae bacterium]